jgi:hypothetical protein
VTAPSSTSLQVTWTAPEDANRWWVTITAGADDRSVGQRTACGSCRSMVVDDLAPGSSYFVRVLAVNAGGGIDTVSSWVAASTPRDASCGFVTSARVCLAVDARTSAGPATGVGLGVLNSITADTAADRVTPLAPKAWRISAGDMAAYEQAKRYGGSITVLLSDPWTVSTGAEAPWARWEFYRWWIGAVTDAYIAAGQVPDYWEVQNEPRPEAYLRSTAATPDLVFEQYRIASEAIHERLPQAKVIGPSPGYVTFGFGLGDVDGFLSRAKAAGIQVGGVSWHEIGGSCLGYCDGSPRAVLQHADDVRAAIAATPGVGAPQLIVNEWGAPWNQRQPGAVVGYLSSVGYAGIDVANQSCWPTNVDTCFAKPGTLDGLLLPDGKTPTDAWFVHRAYAQMTGTGQRLLPSTIADPEASVAATADSSGVIKVLLGRHTGCQTGVDEGCPGFAYAAGKSVQPQIMVPSLLSRYSVTVERIQSISGASKGTTVVLSKVLFGINGRVDVGAIAVADGDALLITLKPM